MSFENKAAKLKTVIERAGGFDEFIKPGGLFQTLLLGEKLDGVGAQVPPDAWSIRELAEAVTTTQFPIITGTLLSNKVMEAYASFEGVADKLVTKFNSKLKLDTIPGVALKGGLRDVVEGQNYPHLADLEEESVTIAGAKRGLILDITEEMIKFDQTGLILMRAAGMGTMLAQDREEKVLYTIQDATVTGVNYYCWYPGGTRVALHSASVRSNASVAGQVVYANQVTDALADYTDIQAALDLFAIMKDGNGKHITINPKILLVPRKLEAVAIRTIKNDYLPVLTASASERNPMANRFDVVVSPLIDDVSNNDWYIGDFKKQFVEKVVMGLEVMTRRDKQNDLAWERDIVLQYKTRYFQQVGSLDHRYVVKSTGGS